MATVSQPPSSVVAVIAGNGLGHYRRTAAFLALLLDRGLAGPVTVVGETWQCERTRGWWATERLVEAGATWHTGVVSPGVEWSTAAARYDDGRLLAWEERLTAVPELADASLVIADNLPQVLAHRPDAVVAGSFLWSDVLEAAHPTSAAVRAFVERERELLDTARPPMVCVEDLVMPGVRRRTKAVAVGWMCDRDVVDTGPSPRAVAVLGGRTGAADDLLRPVAEELVAQGVEVFAPAELDAAGTKPFDHDADWAHVAVVVGRPGAGTLTDCVARAIPIVAVHEPGNSELEHNATRVEALGIGRAAPAEADPTVVAQSALELLDTRTGHDARDQLRRLTTTGLDEATDWLAGRL
jgi:hypothetical protein